MRDSIVVVPTGTANTASILAAFRRLGRHPTMAKSPDEIVSADHVVVPGVGAFGSAMSELDSVELRDVLVSRIVEGFPTLAVCVGLQLLAETSEESPGVRGLGVIPAELSRFDNGLPVPQLGWNEVEPLPGSRLLKPGWAYFANSYRLNEVPTGWGGAISDYGGPFVAALERGNVLACQFHPELSGSWGEEILLRWLTDCERDT